MKFWSITCTSKGVSLLLLLCRIIEKHMFGSTNSTMIILIFAFRSNYYGRFRSFGRSRRNPLINHGTICRTRYSTNISCPASSRSWQGEPKLSYSNGVKALSLPDFHQTGWAMCQNLLENPEDPCIRRIVTCNEKWVYYDQPNKQNQQLELDGQLAVPVAIFFSRFSIKYASVDLMGFWKGFTSSCFQTARMWTLTALYCAQFHRMYKKLSQKYPVLINWKPMLLRQRQTDQG